MEWHRFRAMKDMGCWLQWDDLGHKALFSLSEEHKTMALCISQITFLLQLHGLSKCLIDKVNAVSLISINREYGEGFYFEFDDCTPVKHGVRHKLCCLRTTEKSHYPSKISNSILVLRTGLPSLQLGMDVNQRMSPASLTHEIGFS